MYLRLQLPRWFNVYVFIAITFHAILLPNASATHMAEFILSNKNVSNLNFDDEPSQWLEKFDPKCITAVIIPGWKNSACDNVYQIMAEAYNRIDGKCFNTIRVNWPDSLHDNYSKSVSALRKVADEIAMFIKRMQRLQMIESVELVGFSLGAHMAGLVGRKLSVFLGQKNLVSEIIALDPAGPGFTDFFLTYAEDKLEPTDANVVVTLVTNSGCTGSTKRLGTVNFIANDGRDQTGCARHDCICSHHKALEFFTESLTSNRFLAQSQKVALYATFGRAKNFRSEPGDYYFKTNLISPFARA